MDQRQGGGSPFVYPSKECSIRSPVSPRTPTTEEAHRQCSCPTTLPHNHDRRHLTPPYHTPSPHLSSSTSHPPRSSSPSPRPSSSGQQLLQHPRRSRDLDPFQAGSSSLDDSPRQHAVEAWSPHSTYHPSSPHQHIYNVSPNPNFSTIISHHPLGRPVVVDESTFEHRPGYRDLNEPNEFSGPSSSYEPQRKRSSSGSTGREDGHSASGTLKAIEYDEREHAGATREGAGHITCREGASYRGEPWESSHGRAIEGGSSSGGDRRVMMDARRSPMSSPRSSSQYPPYSSSYSPSSYLVDSYSVHQSGSQPSAMVAPIDNRRYESLDRTAMDGEPRSSHQHHPSHPHSHHSRPQYPQDHPHSHHHPQRSSFSRTSPPLSGCSSVSASPPQQRHSTTAQLSIAAASSSSANSGSAGVVSPQLSHGYPPARHHLDHPAETVDDRRASYPSQAHPLRNQLHPGSSSTSPPRSSYEHGPDGGETSPYPPLPLSPHASNASYSSVPPPPPTSQPRFPQPRIPNIPRQRAAPEEEVKSEESNFDNATGQGGHQHNRSRRSSLSGKGHDNMTRKFGTDMPTTVDLRSAMDLCETLCQFALHYAAQEPQDDCQDGLSDEERDAIHRANLQLIRNLNSTMLTGLQPASNTTTTGGGTGGETMPMDNKDKDHPKPPRPPTMTDDGDDESDDDEDVVQFGKGTPSDELVHELARAATSLFQLAIRIKAWVAMTPEQRELDEEINIIRAKRCLFTDGSTAMPFQSLDAYSQYGAKPYNQDGVKALLGRGRFSNESGASSTAVAVAGPPGFRMPGDLGLGARGGGGGGGGGGEGRTSSGDYDRDYSQASTPYGSFRSTVSEFGDGVMMRTSSGAKTSGAVVDDKEGSPQKYRKRAKRLHPPGRCQSCHTSDTPEWRRGPDGAGTLCNACGLQYAKLLKRQQQQKLQGGDVDDEGGSGRTLENLDFQLLRRPILFPRETGGRGSSGYGILATAMDNRGRPTSTRDTIASGSSASTPTTSSSNMMIPAPVYQRPPRPDAAGRRTIMEF